MDVNLKVDLKEFEELLKGTKLLTYKFGIIIFYNVPYIFNNFKLKKYLN